MLQADSAIGPIACVMLHVDHSAAHSNNTIIRRFTSPHTQMSECTESVKQLHQEIVETLVFPARSDHVVDP